MIRNWKQLISGFCGLLQLIFQSTNHTLALQSWSSFQLKCLVKMHMHTFIHQPTPSIKLVKMKNLHYYWKAMVCILFLSTVIKPSWLTKEGWIQSYILWFVYLGQHIYKCISITASTYWVKWYHINRKIDKQAVVLKMAYNYSRLVYLKFFPWIH